jgi:hypothetical protein
VELSDAVAADLAALSHGLDDPDADLADLTELVQRFGDRCATAVRSYLGFSISLVIDEVAVSVSVLEDFLDPSEIVTSVMLPLSALGDHAADGEIVLYAATPGAFVDLAADLTYALGSGPDGVRLDENLTPPDPALGVNGLTTLSRQNQAIGVLLDRGYESDEALIELHRLARRDSVSVETAARRLVESAVQLPVRELP